ncbi:MULTISPECIES: hypothetical protein [Grimontia]|uniref:Uncharacterized protein n=1 Tax=Grimontia sedimenti TaxID=2711294 RepID=A0A6M1RPA7_9GAMM|nr:MULTISPECIES: hypothetical protein [Grimontia]NGN99319.1 hypothetical protein [Grimontia sedimenti]
MSHLIPDCRIYPFSLVYRFAFSLSERKTDLGEDGKTLFFIEFYLTGAVFRELPLWWAILIGLHISNTGR